MRRYTIVLINGPVMVLKAKNHSEDQFTFSLNGAAWDLTAQFYKSYMSGWSYEDIPETQETPTED